VSCFTACKRTQKWRWSRHFLQNFSAIVPPSAAGFASVVSDAGASCGESWNTLNPWFSSKLGVGHAVGNGTLEKPSCWECSTTVGQAETQLRVVVPIEEEEVN
jgi:hypothetical protein